MRAVIFDIDGTLADVNHRLHYLSNPELTRNQQWNAFFGDQHLDPVIEPIQWLAQTLSWAGGHRDTIVADKRFAVLIVSARPDDHRDTTERWLEQHNIFYDDLYMRKSNDLRADQLVKAEILQQILDDGYDPFLVVDDRPQVVKMWRDYGLTCLQCAPDEAVKSEYAGHVILTLMIGPSGAGKSTDIAKNYKPHNVVSTDDIREQYGWGHSPEDLRKTWRYVHALVEARLKCGIPTVLDATNIKRKDRMAVLKFVPEGQLVAYRIIDRDLDDKLRDRDWRSPELVLKHHRTFQANLKDILDGDQQPNVIVIDKRVK